WSDRRIARNRDPGLEQRAFVGLVLHRDPYRYRFEALESGGRLEICALFTAMQGSMAFWTLGRKIPVGRQRGGAVETAGRCYRLHQPRQPRSGDIDRGPRTLGPGPVIAPGVVILREVATGFLIAALAVLTVAFHSIAGWHSFCGCSLTLIGDQKF